MLHEIGQHESETLASHFELNSHSVQSICFCAGSETQNAHDPYKGGRKSFCHYAILFMNTS